MVEPDKSRLQPQQIDAQIEQLLHLGQEEPRSPNQNAQLAHHLQQYFAQAKQDQILQRVWTSIAQRYEDGTAISSDEERDQQRTVEKAGQYHMQLIMNNRQTVKKTVLPWHLLFAVAVIILVVGSTAVIMNLANLPKENPGSESGGNHPATCTPSPTHPTPTPVEEQSGSSPTTNKRSGGGEENHSTCLPTPQPELPTPTPEPSDLPTPTPGSSDLPTPTPEPSDLPTPTPER